ncbi:hypothetical protein BXT84_10555 [Sulfobacillus thermotolerans]|uniref:Periplasmic binding protein domain-containing protein n=1 Tax=Sulfobacillus thermotolerans TaxID=338644 RepID=A0ABN5H1C3_9FIRM|nr:hypothetical protein BXT84_10555 [Sulfobacillus thermotolerans]
MTKKVIGLALGTVLASMAIAGCGTTQTAAGTTSHSKVIGVSMYSLTNPYFAAMKKSFIENGKKDGLQVEVEASNGDQSTQLAQIETFIQQHVAAVAIVPQDSNSIVTAIKELNQAHIPVFFVDSNANTKLMAQDGAHEVEVVESNNYTGGQTVGQEMVDHYGKNAHVEIGIVNFPTASSTQERDAGFLSVIHQYPGYHVVSTLDGNVSPVTGLQVATDMMEAHPHLQAIFSDTGPAALGVDQAITSMHKQGQVDLFAFSSARQNIAEIENNSVYKAGAMQQPKVEAQVEVANIAKYLDHKSVPSRVLIPVLGVTKANAASRLPLSFGKV